MSLTNPLARLLECEQGVKDAAKALSKAKHDLRQAKKSALGLCPVCVGDMVPMDAGGNARVIGINIMTIRPDFISFGVSLDYNGASDFMTMKKVIK